MKVVSTLDVPDVEMPSHCVFPMCCGSGGFASRLATAGASGQMRNEQLHAVVARSTVGSTFGGTLLDVPILKCQMAFC